MRLFDVQIQWDEDAEVEQHIVAASCSMDAARLVASSRPERDAPFLTIRVHPIREDASKEGAN